MQVKITDMLGAGTIKVPASFVVIEDDYGYAIAVASVYGPNGTLVVSRVGDKDFVSTCNNLGVTNIPRLDKMNMPSAPTGAKLIAGPGV